MKISKVLIGLSQGLLAAHTALAGGGHNGPDLNGPSIPVQVDRLLTRPALGKVITGCVTNMSQAVAMQIFKQEVQLYPTAFYPIQLDQALFFYEKTNIDSLNAVPGSFAQGFANSQDWTASISGAISLYGTQTKKTSLTNLNLSWIQRSSADWDGDSVNPKKNPIYLDLMTENFPFLSFDPVRGKPTFDDLGRERVPEIQVTNLRFYLPKELNEAEPLYNSETKQKTAITINLKKYVDCIKASVQN